MALLLVGVFILGYVLIALEHPLKIDKAASALLTGVFCWLVLLIGFDTMPAFQNLSIADPHELLNESLFEHLGEISGILFFLLGAMTIVELVDAHDGFRAITDRISTTNRVKLLWIISWVSFFLSAGLDNMTTTIIMCALIRRIVRRQENVWLLGGFVVIAANAGGAFSPIGDVTTIMLWIGGQVTTFHVLQELILPSLVSLLVPLLAASFFLKGKVQPPEEKSGEIGHGHIGTTPLEQNAMFVLGGIGLLSVPVFKSITHYPPYMGVLLSVGVLWCFTELLHRSKELEVKRGLTVANILRRIDTPSILFFLGILLAVGALDTSGHLRLLATTLDETFGNIYIINTLIGVLSSLVDNVPLVAATMGMYPLTEFQPDSDFWNLLAYCAGTGGSILIIGSAAGVAAMGILKIDFVWYMKRISLYALLGYFSGIIVYYVLN
ncbi:sodium:proton antiporter NhaD [Salmonirosea aquatica]|uniref:Sodium:proton antiporter n=1 Tax=Salmonirosea aquatica TaxID=2654236 RepID=A0A7C9BBM5_9BACT|nr:sodium:proton antiporter [Cytophagaceae bacterium SJW1-29]